MFSSYQEVAEPLQDLKEGMEQLEKNKTLRYILSTLLAIGNFLNGTNVSCKPIQILIIGLGHNDKLVLFGVIAEMVSDFNGVWIF